MEKEIKILERTFEQKGIKVGTVDFQVIYSPEKSETFRNVAVFEREGQLSLGLPNTKRFEKWLPIYERTPSLRALLDEVVLHLRPSAEEELFALAEEVPEVPPDLF